MDTLLESPYGHWDTDKVGEFNDADFWGFVYEIEQVSTGRCYIGRKQFKFKRKKTLKNKSKTKESDWRWYRSSSELVQSLIEETGPEDFEFRILKLCSGKCELNYEEESLQRERDVLRAKLPDGTRKYLNNCIGYKNFAGLEKQTEETKRKQSSSKMKDMTGQVFGMLTVCKQDISKATGQGVFWICKCSCGQETSVRGGKLRSGHTRSCGCYRSVRVITDEHRHRISLANSGRVCSDETKKLMSDAWTDERRAEVAEANKTRMTPEVREHCRQAKLGIPLSDEHKSALSAAHQDHFWWNNGAECRRGPECPGDGWTAGRLSRRTPK
jgi:hypothetical protein